MKRATVPLFYLLLFFFFLPTLILASLDAPTPQYPTASDSPVWKGRIEFRWNATGAPFYKYFIDLQDGSAKTAVTPSSLMTIHGLEPGSYRWRVSACGDSHGTGCGMWSGDETFEIVLAPPELLGGLQICSRAYDNPATPFDESEPCQLKHLGLLLQHVLDFILWKVSLFILLILAVITGATSYFSLGGPIALARVKTTFRSFFVGFLILMFAWMFVNIVLVLLGFQFEFFGRWWEIAF